MLNGFLNFYQRHAAKRMFARWSPIYEEEVAENAYSAADKVARATLSYLAPLARSQPKIADIGIGSGLLAQQIYDSMNSRITGLDFSQDMMASCAGRGITEQLIPCDAGRDSWPLPDGAFDAAVAAGLFEYLTPSMARHVITQSARILKAGGYLVFTYVPAGMAEKKIRFWRGHSGTYLVCTYDGDELARMVTDAGFEIVEHSAAFAGCVFVDGSSYDYRLIAARRT